MFKKTIVTLCFVAVSVLVASDAQAQVSIKWFGSGHGPTEAVAKAEADSDFVSSAQQLPGYMSHSIDSTIAFKYDFTDIGPGIIWAGIAEGSVTLSDEGYAIYLLLISMGLG